MVWVSYPTIINKKTIRRGGFQTRPSLIKIIAELDSNPPMVNKKTIVEWVSNPPMVSNPPDIIKEK